MKGPFWVIIFVGIVCCSYMFFKMLDLGVSVELALSLIAEMGAMFVLVGISTSKCREDEMSGRAEQRRREKAWRDHIYATSPHHRRGSGRSAVGGAIVTAAVTSSLSDDSDGDD